MARWIVFSLLVSVLLRKTDSQNTVPETVLNCCEGDVLFLLDSSGSVSFYDYSRMVRFLSALLQPFSLGPNQVRVALLQVGTEPHLEFGFEAHNTQQGLQGAILGIRQLQGDTNTEAALRLARERVLVPGGQGGARAGLPRVLVWLTDGVQPGAVEGPMAELRQEEIIRAERLQVRDVTSSSAMLQWRPVLSGATGYYDIRFGPIRTGVGGQGSHDTSSSTGAVQYRRLTRPGDSTWAELTDLQPDTMYNATLMPESNLDFLKPLSVTFTTLPEVLSPTMVTVSESSTNSVRVSWGPLQPNSVQRYQVEYSALPRGEVRIISVGRNQDSAVLPQLQPDTEYLVTVSALHSTGRERAMSIRVCTQEELPGLKDLELTTVGSDSVQVRWRGSVEGLRGYWVSWEGGSDFPGHTSSRYLPPNSFSTLLTHLRPTSRICVSPVYRTARGNGLCCTAQTYSNAVPWGHGSYGSA
ncbi:hypothetical protein JZ751_017690 [Albula glossodonta]|uniref:von Willebrand factor A domain-containing protein 1 n=1 Tax=Albula glossodonta TaxID=121402 RepID=A0A8T2PP34_9TELE|nr:hypothetical protein JZ751_017690 [Albula glossodonta]